MTIAPRTFTLLTALLLTPVLIQTLIPIAPDLYWDIDPRSPGAELPATSLGPAAMAWLNTLSVALAGVALTAHALAGGKTRRAAVLLTLLGITAAGYHMFTGEAQNLMRCGNWIAASATALALLHLAQHDRPRKLIMAALAGLVIPLALRAALYVFVEHRETLDQFLRGETEFLASRGWTAGSPQHLMYRRRIEQADAIGAFGLSNVFGSIVAALTVLSAALTVGRWKTRGFLAALLPAGLTAAGLFAVYLTRSKGAALVLAPVAGLIVLAWRGRDKGLSPAALLLVALAIGAVFARGAVGPPPTHEGERSILFRFHYWQGAANMIADSSLATLLLGRGPDGFAADYPRYKNPLNPEEVTSTHNVFLDYTVMLGAGGLAWAALLLTWLWYAGRLPGVRAGGSDDDAPRAAKLDLAPADLGLVLILAVLTFGAQYVVSLRPAPLLENAALWIVSAAAFVVVSVIVMSPGWIAQRWAGVALLAAAAALLIHNQIEMTFFHFGSCALAWVIPAAAAAEPATPAGPKRTLAFCLTGATVLSAVALVWCYTLPVQRQQSALRQAADALRAGQLPAAGAALERAGAIIPADLSTLQHRARLLAEQAHHAAAARNAEEARGLLRDALRILDQALARGRGDASPLRLSAQLSEQLAHLTGHEDQALQRWRDVIKRSPTNIQDHLRLADLLSRRGETEEARRLCQRVLELNDQSYLDPLRQLSGQELERVRACASAGRATPSRP